MKSNVIFFVLATLLLSSLAAAEAAETNPGTSSGEQITQTISLQPGWNSVSFKISGLSFDEDIKPQCSFRWYNQELDQGKDVEDISEDERYHVWTQRGGSWSHPDNLEVSRGYSFNVDSECELEVSGERKRVDTFELEDGWNLANVPSGLALGQIKKECKLRWYNQDLEEGASADEIAQDNRYYYWVNDGGSWRNPHKEKDHRGDDGVYINSDGSCKISSWPYDGKEPDNENSEDSDTNSQTENIGNVDRDINYENIDIKWDGLSDSQLSALSGVPRGMVRKGAFVGNSVDSPAKLSEVVRIIREDAIDVFSWQYKATSCAEVNPEDCSASGNTFYVSSGEGWVLDPGTPAPHCYPGEYTPPAYGQFSDQVKENVPQVDTSYSDTDENQECPGWLEEEIDYLEQIVPDDEYSETNDINWNDWVLETSILDGKNDELGEASGDGKAVIDSGNDGYCGKAYFEKDFSVNDRTSDKLEIDYNVVADDWAGKAFINANGNEIASIDPQGQEIEESGTWTVYIASETNTIEFGIQDTSEENCQNTDHDVRLEVTDVSRSDTSIATPQ